jgi:peptidyl-dipeptidase Dcp
MRVLVLTITLTVSSAVAQQPFQNSNPFFSVSTLTFEAPRFDRIKDSDYRPAIEEGMRQEIAEIEKISNSPEPPNFVNTIEAMERTGSLLHRVQKTFNAVTQANTNPALQRVQSDEAPKFAAHRDAIYLNRALFARVKSIHDERTSLSLDPESRYLLDRYYRDFVHAGAQLSDADMTTLRALNAEQAKLQVDFRTKLLADNNASAVIVDSVAELDGLTPADIATASEAAKIRGLIGKYVITLQNTTQQPAQSYLKNRAIRERLFRASSQRGRHGGDNDTTSIVRRLAQLRAQRAKLLGFSDYAEYGLVDQMAETPDKAVQLMTSMVPAAVAKAHGEAEGMQQMIGAAFKLEPWDWQVLRRGDPQERLRH